MDEVRVGGEGPSRAVALRGRIHKSVIFLFFFFFLAAARSILMWGLSYQTRDYTWAAAVKTPNPNYQATRKLTRFHCAKCFSNVPCVEPCSLGPQNVGTERCLKDGASPSADEEAEVREGQCLSQGHKARVGKPESGRSTRIDGPSVGRGLKATLRRTSRPSQCPA